VLSVTNDWNNPAVRGEDIVCEGVSRVVEKLWTWSSERGAAWVGVDEG
jgi:hypothetical protein